MTQDFSSIEARFRTGLATGMGFEAAAFDHPGTVIAPVSDRAGSAMAVFYRIGARTVAWCDPAVADELTGLANEGTSFPIEDVETWAAGEGAEFVGGGWSHLATLDMLADPEPLPGYEIRKLDRDDAHDRSHIQGLIDVCDEGDLEASETEMDDLDPIILGVFGEDGLAGLAGARPWEYDHVFGDIGVLVHPEERGSGLGRLGVARLSRALFEISSLPLYRCNFDRMASRRLALSLGFRQVVVLAAVRFG